MDKQARRTLWKRASVRLERLPNPFIYDYPKTRLTKFYRYSKLVVGGLLFPLRLAEIVAISFGCWASAKLTVLQGIHDDQPLTRLQRLTMWPIKIYGRLLLWVLGFYRIKVIGQPAPPSVAPIVVANHVSFVEPIYLFTQLFPTSVSRKENEQIGLIGPILKSTHAILVDRLDPNSRQATIKAIRDRAELAATGRGFPQVLIFPEGCTTNGKALVTFKTGAFTPGLPVQPVAFKYPYKFYDPSWCADGPGLLGMLLELTSQFKNSMTVTYLPVYYPSEEEKRDPLLYADNVRRVIAKELGLPVTDHSYEDALLLVHAHKHNMPLQKYNLEIRSLKNLLKLDFDGAKDLIKRFAEVNKKKKVGQRGQLTLEEFAILLNLPVSDAISELFNKFDKTGAGLVDWRDFILGIAGLGRDVAQDADDTIAKAFLLFDTDGDGKISSEESAAILRKIFPGISETEVSRLFTEADADHDNYINFEEFSKFYKKHPEYIKIAQKVMTTGSATPPVAHHQVEPDAVAAEPAN